VSQDTTLGIKLQLLTSIQTTAFSLPCWVSISLSETER